MDFPSRITITRPRTTRQDVHAARLRRDDTAVLTACGLHATVEGPIPSGKRGITVTCPRCTKETR